MSKAIFTWFNYEMPIEERLKAIKNAGFDSVLLWWADDKKQEGSNYILVPELCDKYGLAIQNAHLPFDKINLLWRDDLSTKDYFAYIKKLIKECGDAKISTAVLHTSNGENPLPVTRRGLEKFARITEYALENNVKIAFENLYSSKHLDLVYQNINYPNKGICYDCGHKNCFTPDVDLLSKYSGEVIATHLHDNNGNRDAHKLPFDGSIDWADLKQQLICSGVDGDYALEVFGGKGTMYEDMSPQEFLELANARLEKFINL